MDHVIKIKRNLSFCEGFPDFVFSTDYALRQTERASIALKVLKIL